MSITFLPLDLSGRRATNLIANESHPLIRVAGKTNRVFVCNHGAFYATSVMLRDATNRALVKGVDYKATYHYGELSTATGKDIQGLVIITNLAVVSPVRITYQAVGGPFSISVAELKLFLETLATGEERFTFEEIVGKPTAYKPKDHKHEYWQLYGMETVVKEIDRIGAAYGPGSKAIERENTNYGAAYVQKGKDAITTYTTRVKAHINDINNPHQTDKVKVGLNEINNWAMSTPAQALSRTNDTSYMPIDLVYSIQQQEVIPLLAAHEANINNPHGTTAGMAGCYIYSEVDNKFSNRLLWTSAAYNSTLWAGRTKANASNDIRYNLNAWDVVSGRWPYNQVGSGYNPADNAYSWALCGDGVWRNYAGLFAAHNANRRETYNAGIFENDAIAANWLNTYLPNVPIGSLSFSYQYSNPTPNIQFWSLCMWVKNAASGGWARLV